MDQCISSTDMDSRTCDETSFDDESELNTADLSHISGLSKILRVDDSIADRVRCLLTSDTEDGDQGKPELLSSAKELPSSDELAERISKLLQDGDSASNADNSNGNKEDKILMGAKAQSQGLGSSVPLDEKKNSSSEVSEKVDIESHNMGVSTAINGRRSGDGADNEPTTITAESSDDIMNVSDATEYSDLPKVVDNPIKRLSTSTKSSSQLAPHSTNNDPPKASKSLGIRGKEEPNTGSIVGDSNPKDDEYQYFHSPLAKMEIPSRSSTGTQQTNMLGHVDLTGDKLMKDHTIAQSSINTAESRDIIGSKDNGSHSHDAQNSEGHLPDEKLLSRIRKAVSNSTLNSASLKGPHTSSEQSIASSIDSLGLKVKSLLKEKESESVADADVSFVSNYSEEISNFEKTNLWKYTRQFLPGAIFQPSTIERRAQFPDASSPIVVKDTTTDSSASSTPVTYRLAREVVTPTNMAPYLERDSFHPSYSQKSPSEVHRFSNRDITNLYTVDDSVKSGSIPISTSPLHRGAGIEFCPQPSTYSSAPDDSKDCTPESSSYKSLYPQYPDTPYSFVTPRRVAWEPERNRTLLGSAHVKNVPIERSAYFNPERLSVQNYPTPVQRTSAAPYRRLTPDVTEYATRQNLTRKDKTTCTNERSLQSSHYDISTKPVTPTLTKPTVHNADSVAFGTSRMRHSPKTVRFDRTASPFKSELYPNDVKSASLPEYSFTTPKTANHPRRNITPKVDRENPLPSKSLPTYDQMIMEEDSRKSHVEKDADDAMLIKPEIASVSVKKSPTKDNVIRSSTPTGTSQANQHNMGFSPDTGTFSALKPEICLDESVCTDDVVRLTAIETDNNALLSRDNGGSDVRLRAAISPDEDAAATSFNDPTISVAANDGVPDVCPTEMQSQDLDPPLIDTEPAPLPYVRLGRKRTISPFRKGRTPPRHSISTEKVQTLLMKEAVPRSGNASADFARTVPSSDYSSSSDDDLLNLMETVASKVPLMQKLLKKLYDRNVERKNKQESGIRINTGLNVDTHTTTDQCVQTMNSPSKNSNAAMANRNAVKETVTESSCQTSLLKPKKRILVAHKATSPMEDCDSIVDEEEIAQGRSPNKQPAPSVDKCNKENNRETKQPCAFFVDMTPKKSGILDDVTEIGEKQSVAWYEPYKYVPFWRREQTQRKTLGFVDANVQDAFLNNKRDFVLRSWERQEDIAHRAQERRLRELEQNIHDQIRALHKEKAFKTASSTCQPTIPKKRKERVFGWKEMKLASKQKYDALPEIVAKKQEAERLKYYEANRKRAEMYKRRITQMIVQRQRGKLSSEVR